MIEFEIKKPPVRRFRILVSHFARLPLFHRRWAGIERSKVKEGMVHLCAAKLVGGANNASIQKQWQALCKNIKFDSNYGLQCLITHSTYPMTSIIKWQCAQIEEFSAVQMHAILKVRCDVFIIEQNCVFPDIDNKDLIALHLVAWTDDNQVAAYLRILPPNTTFTEPSLGRVLSAQAFRGTGIGRQLMEQGLQHLEARYPNSPVRIGAQSYLVDFYSTFGFAVASEEYIEDGIAHIDMLRPAQP